MARHFALMIATLVTGAASNFAAPDGSMSEGRLWHGAAKLKDGRILACGGRQASGKGSASADIFDPKNSSWSSVDSMSAGRWGHTLTALKDGTAITAGSGGDSDLFDPKSGKWTTTGGLNTRRYHHTATLLDDGRVLVAGGLTITGNKAPQKPLTSAELYDPKSGKWTKAADMARPRYHHSSTLLKDGRVLVVGGLNDLNLDAAPYAQCEIYDPKTNSWQETAPMKRSRLWQAEALLKDGRVLIIGGYSQGKVSACEIFDPSSGKWSKTESMSEARYDLNAAVLEDGRVVVISGGTGSGTPSLTSTEVYDPDKGSWSAGPKVKTARRSHTTWVVGPSQVMAVGGWSQWGGKLLPSGEIVKLDSN